MKTVGIELRPERPDDESLVRQIYKSAREADLDAARWPGARKTNFLDVQFRLERAHLRRNYPSACFNIVVENGCPAGRFYVDRAKDEFRVLDVALLPEYRQKGIGTMLLRALVAEAADAGLPVKLHVGRNNRAVRLCERLGFRVVADQGVCVEMEWRPVRQ